MKYIVIAIIIYVIYRFTIKKKAGTDAPNQQINENQDDEFIEYEEITPEKDEKSL